MVGVLFVHCFVFVFFVFCFLSGSSGPSCVFFFFFFFYLFKYSSGKIAVETSSLFHQSVDLCFVCFL